MVKSLESLIHEELEQLVPQKPFFSPLDISDLVIFGSLSNVYKILNSGEITYLRTSPKKIIVPRHAIVEYLRKKLNSKVS